MWMQISQKIERRKSTMSYVFSINGGAISSESKFRLVVALSTTKAEYIAMAYACKEAIWLKRLIEELKVK